MEEAVVEVAGGTAFDALAAGPDDGDLVLLLHGFPQDASSFADVLPVLGAAGLRAVAVTQRGFSPRNRPVGRGHYAYAHLAEDVLAVAAALGSPRPHVVGHDLGALVGWHLAGRVPERIATLTAVSVPHPAAYVRSLPRSRQAMRSAYVPVLRLPIVSEALLGAAGGAVLRRLLTATGLPDRHATGYVDRLLPGGGLRAALSWYRNLDLREMASTPAARVPTTFVWSDGDAALDRVGAEGTGAQVDAPYRFAVLEGCPHWIPEREPGLLAELIVDRAGGSG